MVTAEINLGSFPTSTYIHYRQGIRVLKVRPAENVEDRHLKRCGMVINPVMLFKVR